MAPKSCVFRFADLEVHEREFLLVRAGEASPVEPKAFRVLLLLLRNPGKLLTKEELLNAVWGDTAVSENSLARAIALLRRLLRDEARDPHYIETVATVGYRFICKVEICEDISEKPETPATPSGLDSGVEWEIAAPSLSSGPQSMEKRGLSGRAFWMWPIGTALALVLAWLLRPALPPPQVLGTTQLTHDGANKIPGFLARPPMVSDGSRLYFHEINSGVWPMMQVSTEGGETVRLDVPLPPYDLADISPDGRELLLGAWPPPNKTDRPDLELWRLPVVSGMQLRRIGNISIDWMAATLSPNGKVLYYSLHSDLFAADADGGHPRKLITLPGGPSWLRVSPDGSLIRFSVGNPQSGNFSIFEARTDGSGLRQLFPGFSNGDGVCCGNWTPDGKYFVFESMRGIVSTLWAVRETGEFWRKVSKDPVQLTHGEMSADCPLPSKDGKRVFFFGIHRRGEVMRYDFKTHALTPFLPGFSASGLNFTRDGQRMVYVSYPEDTLWQSRTDGTDRHQLTFSPMLAGVPRWSPDGSQIAFSGTLPGKRTQVFVIPAGGGTPEQLTSGDVDSGDPTWSSDGTSLAYAGPWSPQLTSVPIHIINLRTREVGALPDSAGMYSPRWSPDGRYLLASPLGPKTGILLYDFSLRSWQRLSDDKQGAAYPSWTADGRCIYFNIPEQNHSVESRICLTDRKVEQIADMAKTGTLALTSGGEWTGLAPDGSILALRNTSTQEVYALEVKLP